MKRLKLSICIVALISAVPCGAGSWGLSSHGETTNFPSAYSDTYTTYTTSSGGIGCTTSLTKLRVAATNLAVNLFTSATGPGHLISPTATEASSAVATATWTWSGGGTAQGFTFYSSATFTSSGNLVWADAGADSGASGRASGHANANLVDAGAQSPGGTTIGHIVADAQGWQDHGFPFDSASTLDYNSDVTLGSNQPPYEDGAPINDTGTWAFFTVSFTSVPYTISNGISGLVGTAEFHFSVHTDLGVNNTSMSAHAEAEVDLDGEATLTTSL